MRLIVPDTTFTLNSTNVDASSLNEWSSASVDYSLGQQVKLTAGYSRPLREYECIQAHTSAEANKPQAGSNAYWADRGAINQHRMFDGTNTLRTLADDASGDIVVEVGLTRRLQTIALLGLQDVSAVRIIETVTGTEAADNSYPLGTVMTPVGWWSHYYGEREYAGSVVHDLYGLASTRSVSITLSGATTAACAQCLIGKAIDLGPTEWGGSPRLKSWSTWEEDPYLGYKFVPRKTTRAGSYTIWADTSDFDRIYRLMESLLDTLVLLDANNSGSNYDALRAFGKITEVAPPQGLRYNKTPIDFTIEGAG